MEGAKGLHREGAEGVPREAQAHMEAEGAEDVYRFEKKKRGLSSPDVMSATASPCGTIVALDSSDP